MPTNEALPSLPFESDRVRTVRARIQKPYSREEFLAWVCHRKLSVYVSLAISRYTKISANSITFLMLIISAVAPVAILSLARSGPALILGACLVHVVYFLDVVDGEVARLRGATSLLGARMDACLWVTMPAIYAACIFRACQDYSPLASTIVTASAVLVHVTRIVVRLLASPSLAPRQPGSLPVEAARYVASPFGAAGGVLAIASLQSKTLAAWTALLIASLWLAVSSRKLAVDLAGAPAV